MAIRIGARGSQLSRTQASWVAGQLQAAGADVELIWIETQGDARSEPLQQIGGQGVFTKEIQRALLDGRADLAVHSLKDLPTLPVDRLLLAATPPREQVDDMLLTRDEAIADLEDLPPRAVVGTGSARRRAQLLHRRADLEIRDIRGNVETRLAKLEQGEYDAIVLAAAGLRRLHIDRRMIPLPLEWMLPAVGQGALGLECRREDEETAKWLEKINHPPTLASVTAERAMLAALQGGCLAPVAAWARLRGGDLVLDGCVLSLDGDVRLTAAVAVPDVGELCGRQDDRSWGEAVEKAGDAGRQAAEELISQGAERLLAR